MAAAKRQTAVRNKGQRKKSSKKAKGKHVFKRRAIGVLVVFFGLIFLPTSVLLFVGMMPTIVAGLVAQGGLRPLTVGAMNLAGASPFLLELWSRGHNFSVAFDLVSNPMTVVVMYCSAAIGYLIDWSVTGMISTILLQRGKARKKAIKKQQEELIERWGREVTGDYPMDEKGFAAPGAFDEDDVVEEESQAAGKKAQEA